LRRVLPAQSHVKDGVIVRIEGDDRPTDSVADPQLRPCIRGRSYRRRQYHPDRLKHPMKRIGQRGEARFERISWDEALDQVAAGLVRIKETYGNSAMFVPYGMQRRAYGEQVVRAGCVLAAITGNVDLPGGWAGGMAFQAPDGGPFWNVFPSGPNPVKARIPSFLWTEAVTRGKQMPKTAFAARRGSTTTSG
jgi:anaerobic selenocysteine-containing dehydrogenase